MKEHKFDQETVETLSEILGQLAPLPANESPVSHLNIPKIEKLNGIARIKLSLQEGILKYQGEAVKKINLIKLAHTAVVELTLPSKKIFLLDSGPEYKNIDRLSNLILDHSLKENAFLNQEVRAKHEQWKKNDTEKRYRPDITAFYAIIYDAMAEVIANYYKNKNINNLLVISAGCGSGNDIKAMADKLKLTLPACEILRGGFTLRDTDRAKAEEQNPNGYFLQGKLKHINQHIANIKSHFSKFGDIGNTVLVFSGTATRDINDGTYATIAHFQKAFLQEVDLYLVDGYQPLTITPRLAKAIGYQYNYRPQKSHNNLLIFTKQSDEQRIQYLENKSNKYADIYGLPVIDLSLSADVLRDLALLTKHAPLLLENMCILDVSWSQIKEEDIEKVIEYIKQLPNLQSVYIANIEPWSSKLVQALSQPDYRKYEIKQRLDSHDDYYQYEVAPLPISAAKRLGFFSQVPTKPLLKQPLGHTNNNNGINSLYAAMLCPSYINLNDNNSIRKWLKTNANEHTHRCYIDPNKAFSVYNTQRDWLISKSDQLILVEFVTDAELKEIPNRTIGHNGFESIYLCKRHFPILYIQSVSILDNEGLKLVFHHSDNLQNTFAEYDRYLIDLLKPCSEALNKLNHALINIIINKTSPDSWATSIYKSFWNIENKEKNTESDAESLKALSHCITKFTALIKGDIKLTSIGIIHLIEELKAKTGDLLAQKPELADLYQQLDSIGESIFNIIFINEVVSQPTNQKTVEFQSRVA